MKRIAKRIVFHISRILPFLVLIGLSFLVSFLFRVEKGEKIEKKSYLLLSGDQISIPVTYADVPGGGGGIGDSDGCDTGSGDSSGDC